MEIKIDYNKCGWKKRGCKCDCNCERGCIGCAEVCPTGAIRRKNKVTINKSKCILCGACVKSCPNKAISLV